MAIQIPNWLLGRHVTGVVAQYQIATAASNGRATLAAGGSVATLTGLIDGLSYAGRDNTEVIVPLAATRENEVAVESDDTVVLSEILRSPANSGLLAALYNNADSADYVLLTFLQGSTTGAIGTCNRFSMIGLMADYSVTYRKGKHVGRMTLAQCDTFDALSGLPTLNPSYGIITDPAFPVII